MGGFKSHGLAHYRGRGRFCFRIEAVRRFRQIYRFISLWRHYAGGHAHGCSRRYSHAVDFLIGLGSPVESLAHLGTPYGFFWSALFTARRRGMPHHDEFRGLHAYFTVISMLSIQMLGMPGAAGDCDGHDCRRRRDAVLRHWAMISSAPRHGRAMHAARDSLLAGLRPVISDSPLKMGLRC